MLVIHELCLCYEYEKDSHADARRRCAGTTASDVISGKSPLAKHTEFRSFAILNVACNSLSESARAIGGLDMQRLPLTGSKELFWLTCLLRLQAGACLPGPGTAQPAWPIGHIHPYLLTVDYQKDGVTCGLLCRCMHQSAAEHAVQQHPRQFQRPRGHSGCSSHEGTTN
jgi:hypothetical protein